MGVQYLDTSGFVSAEKAVREGINSFNGNLKDIQSITNTILNLWIGEGRNEFATQISLINLKLRDISDELYEIYDAIVQAEKTYIDSDQEIAKKISISGGE